MSKNDENEILQEATGLPDTDFLWGESLDAAFLTALVDRTNTPIKNLPAYKLGLIDSLGNILQEPKTKNERRALTYLDRVVLFMRKSMGGRVILLNNMYRKARITPSFVQAASRARSLRFMKYYDLKVAFFEKPINLPTHLGFKGPLPQGK